MSKRAIRIREWDKKHAIASTAEGMRLLFKLYEVQLTCCFYCGCKIAFRRLHAGPNIATVDHFYPLSSGGRDDITNVVLACVDCNQRKGDRRPNLLELMKWNDLAAIWPHIGALDPALHSQPKLCVWCGAHIPIDRMVESLKAQSETTICSRPCAAQLRARRKRARRLARREELASLSGSGTASPVHGTTNE